MKGDGSVRFQLCADLKTSGKPYHLKHATTGRLVAGFVGGARPTRPMGWGSAKEALTYAADVLSDYVDPHLVFFP